MKSQEVKNVTASNICRKITVEILLKINIKYKTNSLKVRPPPGPLLEPPSNILNSFSVVSSGNS